ncbi:MAG: hypothetical protein KAI76_09225 [Alphaproteobacteria bacterium]|nr:hypothetical protein [Alphaproteobacteria bacterium]
MTSVSRIAFTLVLSGFLSLLMGIFSPTPGFAWEKEIRTVNRTVTGIIHYPKWLYNRPAHYEFLPLVSNNDPAHKHPGAWDGQDWDASKWNEKWTPEVAIKKFFQAHIFERQYLRNGVVPVLELGRTFYKLSDLDQRRTLKLLTEQTEIFKQGYGIVELVDWSTLNIVGSYTPKGMFLN